MTKKQKKDLLLKDLYARLPYGVKFRTLDSDSPFTLEWIDKSKRLNGDVRLKNAQIYLRPLWSITDEEWKECVELGIGQERDDNGYKICGFERGNNLYDLYDWLNKNMFDYRDLIEQGLAISTEEFNPYKD